MNGIAIILKSIKVINEIIKKEYLNLFDCHEKSLNFKANNGISATNK